MSEFKLVARFEHEPSEENKKEAERIIIKFLSDILPDSKLTVDVFHGSWIIVVTAWLIDKAGGWLVEKAFDRAAQYFQEEKDSKTTSSSDMSKLPISPNSPASSSGNTDDFLLLMEKASELMSQLDELNDSKCTRVMFAHFGEKGQIMDFEKRDGETTLKLIQVDNVNQFNDYLLPKDKDS